MKAEGKGPAHQATVDSISHPPQAAPKEAHLPQLSSRVLPAALACLQPFPTRPGLVPPGSSSTAWTPSDFSG